MSDIYLTDLAHTGDLRVSPTGDLEIVEGVANVKQALLHRLITVPGSLVTHSNWGVGISNFQNAPMTLANQRKIALLIAEQYKQDERVVSLESVSVRTVAASGTIVISGTVKLKSNEIDSFEFAVGEI